MYDQIPKTGPSVDKATPHSDHLRVSRHARVVDEVDDSARLPKCLSIVFSYKPT